MRIESDVHSLKDHSTLLMDYHPIQGGVVILQIAMW